jgi:Gp37 protein
MATTMQICNAILARLETYFPDLAVEYFPDDAETYRLNHSEGALLISYLGAHYGPPESTFATVQKSMAVFSVTVTMRNLNGTDGAIDILDKVRPVMQGFKAPGCKKMQLMQDRFLGQSHGVWQYALDVGTETIAIEPGEEELAPRITAINSEENQ